MHRSARNIHCCCVFVFLLRFVKLGFTVFKGSFFGHCMNSDPGSSLRSARNASVKITKLFVKRHVNSFMQESESSSKSIFFVGECSWVVLEQNWVQDTSADFIV